LPAVEIMSDVIFPRSPKEMMAGWAYLPRFVDKIRLTLAGKLHADYQPNFAYKGFDAQWLKAAGLEPETFIEVVKHTVTDGEVCDWVRRHVSPAKRESFNLWVSNYGSEADPELQARLKMRKAQSGLGHRDDLRTFVDYIDADEKRS
jgi:hypothetical protein